MAKRKSKTKESRPKQNRVFGLGEKVKIAKKSWVVDRERSQEGLPQEERVPIEQDMTGQECEVTGFPYWSEEKGEACVPIKLSNEAVISVPESRLERAHRHTPTRERLERSDGVENRGGSAPSKETVEFWRKYFSEQEKDAEE